MQRVEHFQSRSGEQQHRVVPVVASLFPGRIDLPLSASLPHLPGQLLSRSVAIVRGAKAATRRHRVLQSLHASSVVRRANVSRKLLHDVYGQLPNGSGSCAFVRALARAAAGSCDWGRLAQASKIESTFHPLSVEHNRNGKASLGDRRTRGWLMLLRIAPLSSRPVVPALGRANDPRSSS